MVQVAGRKWPLYRRVGVTSEPLGMGLIRPDGEPEWRHVYYYVEAFDTGQPIEHRIPTEGGYHPAVRILCPLNVAFDTKEEKHGGGVYDVKEVRENFPPAIAAEGGLMPWHSFFELYERTSY